ncbi:MAG: 50S ribosomal protein L29 [Patescibacteria group bacterium]|nr:50S ribosomal protein L29 [Patescibacteria group bacterium]
MKKTDIQNLRNKSAVELANDLKTDRDTLWQLRNDVANGKVKNVSEVRKVKKRIAIINTILKETNTH